MMEEKNPSYEEGKCGENESIETQDFISNNACEYVFTSATNENEEGK
jgi:hypothetical protein